jgi:DNA topoisomerase-1
MRDREMLERIRALVIPPAWSHVWICPHETGHIQVTARDARGRKQYRYHSRWRETRDANKYEQLHDFVRGLPALRKAVGAHLRLPGLPREKVLAAVVRLLETTFIRIGNEKYARENGSFGLTTMRNRHVRIRAQTLQFDFRGKSGKQHHIELADARLAAIVRRCRDLPGQELFQYVDENGEARTISSADVNEYLSGISGGRPYTAKDFRTWAGTVLAALALNEQKDLSSETQARKNVVEAIRAVALRLGNTPAICRKCYVHPGVLEAYFAGRLAGLPATCVSDNAALGLKRRHELAVLRLLRPARSRRRRALAS